MTKGTGEKKAKGKSGKRKQRTSKPVKKEAAVEQPLAFKIEADELDLFLQEVNEHLQVIESGILHLEQEVTRGEGSDPDILNGVFRAAHTLKAVAATVGHQRLADLTHTLETLFDTMRQGTLSPTQTVTDELLATIDALKELRNEVTTGQSSGVDVTGLLDRLQGLMEEDVDQVNGSQERHGRHQPRLSPDQAARLQECRKNGDAVLELEIRAAERSASSARLLQAILALEEVGDVITQQPTRSDLLDGQDAGHLWLLLATQAGKKAVGKALQSVSELADFQIQPYKGTATPTRLDASRAVEDVSKAAEEKTVRISVGRLDALMNLVGELVTDRTRLEQIQDTMRLQHRGDGTLSALNETTAHFSRVVDQLQQEVMQARMLPISHLFAKFPRLVRDVARAADKQVNLVISGEATELDRSVIEVISDPLIHLLRNAVDHGIEPTEERLLQGKPVAGTVWLTAAHEEGHIVITVKDDGHGIDPERIRRAAVQRGLLSEEQAAKMDDDSVVSIIFQPNLSTSPEVTEVSGRGVGLDVVRTNIKNLSGSVVVESEVGKGTTFRLTLPLTLAIVQTMLVGLGDGIYAIPLASIIETLYLADVDLKSVKGQPTIGWRDEVLPLLYLREFFTHRRLTATPTSVNGQAIVTVAWGKQRVGLIVDHLIGKQEIVIKSLSPSLGNIPGLSGCAILGDGNISLIIDVPGLIGAAAQTKAQGVAS